MKIKRSNYLEIYPENKQEEIIANRIIENYCIHINPDFENKKRKNNYFRKIPQYLNTFIKKTNMFKVYKAHKQVYDTLLSQGFPVEVIDERVGQPIEVNCKFGPRDKEQAKALEALKNNQFGYGVLEAVPAAGKTYMSINMMCHYKQRTLIIVDMTLLIEQFIESLLKFTDLKEDEIGIIRGSDSKITDKHKVILATVQTLVKKKDLARKIAPSIGYLVIDEVHVSACSTFQEVIPLFKPKYQLGLSGTPNRDDKKEFLIFESVGPIVYIADRKAMLDSGSMLLPVLRPILLRDDENFYKNSDECNMEFRDVVEDYYLDERSIDTIAKIINFHYQQNDYQLLVCKETAMVDSYYKAIINKIYGFNVYEKALEQQKELLDELNKKYLDEKNNIEQLKNVTEATVTKLKKEKRTRSFKKSKMTTLDNKYEKKYKRISKMKWYELPIVAENELFETVKIIDGKLNKEKRDKIINDTNDGKVKVVISTTVTDKAISISRLNVLYLLFSTRERANTVQRVG